jgi:nicotinamide-nucleotide amidase
MENYLDFQNTLDEATISFERNLKFSLAKLFGQTKLKVSINENITEGALTKEITSLTNSHTFFIGSFISWQIKLQIKILGLLANSIKKYSLLSPEITYEMANSVKNLFTSDLGLTINGNYLALDKFNKNNQATFFIAIAHKKEKIIKQFQINGGKNEIIKKATQAALLILKYFLENLKKIKQEEING